MTEDTVPRARSSWLRDVLNGFVLWCLAFVLYLLPGLALGVSMGMKLGPQGSDQAEISRQIGQAVSEMYRTSPYLVVAYVIVLVILVYWRSRVVSRKSAASPLAHAAVVAVVPSILTALEMILFGRALAGVIVFFVLMAAGLVAGRRAAAPQPA